MQSEKVAYTLGIVATWAGVGLSAANTKNLYVLGFLILLGLFITYICIVGLIHTAKSATPVRRYSGPTFQVTAGPLAEKYMIIVNFEGATCMPYQEQIRDNRTCIFFGCGWITISNTNPADVMFQSYDPQLGIRIADLNRLVEFEYSKFGSMAR